MELLPTLRIKKVFHFIPFKEVPVVNSLTDQRHEKKRARWDEKSGVGSIIPKDILKQKLGNHLGMLDEVVAFPLRNHQRHRKQVPSNQKRRGRTMKEFERYARGMLPGIILLLVLLNNLLGVVKAQADCLVLNDWVPDHANSTGCCAENGIICIDDRVTEL
jgi:hypothetical protein